MKKILLFFAIIICIGSNAQNPSYRQKLYYTCKVWGFVKYYHSNVSVCGVNWDSVLIHCLPLVKNAVTKNDFNNALDTMLNAAGPMAIATSPTADTMGPELKRNLNFGWINDTMLRTDVQVILDTIKNNFRPHAECWVQNNAYTNSYQGWLVFPHDSLMLSQPTYTSFPDEWHRLMLLYKHWNIINYFNPYRYNHNIPWDSTLYHNVLGFDGATTDFNFNYALNKLNADNDDAHTEGLTYISDQWFPYGYSVQLILKYIPNKYVVVQSGVPGIINGDEIISIGGVTTKQWEANMKSYVSAGDTAVFRRFMCTYMLCRDVNASTKVIYRDSTGTIYSIIAPQSTPYYSNWFYTYYPNDTLASVSYRYWSNCNIGYVNMGVLQQADVSAMYSTLQNTSAIIFDIRNYPNGTAWPIANLMYPNQTTFAKLTIPDVTYPGTFYWTNDYLGVNGNTSSYKGKVILLFNEETQSQAEFSCMILGAMPNVVKIGSQTAGTDGNVTYYRMSPNIQTGFTTLGVYYPNGDSTERIGIRPDSSYYPTARGIGQNRDEVLEKALEVAGCPLAIQNITQIKSEVEVYPNPATDNIQITASNLSGQSATLSITDITGRVLLEKTINITNETINTHIDIGKLSPAVYLISLKASSQSFATKIVKE
jgi:carboxyl-terminal processing protease